jgi:DNA-binding PadR family transcriptional regulator
MSLREFSEQAGAFELLVILLEKESLGKAEIVALLKRSSTTAYSALKLLKKANLITEVEAKSFPYRKDVTLTEKGRKVAELVREIQALLLKDH